MDEHHFELWADNLRRSNKVWNAGFRWGALSGATIMFVSLAVLGWLMGL